jgi:uncharacterized protein (TIGR02145 family)
MGPQGPAGSDGAQGPQGEQGPSGTVLPNGNSNNDILFWNQNEWTVLSSGNEGQTLAICNGSLTWVTNGTCPSTTGITAVSCGATNILNPTSSYGNLIDQDGNSYKTLRVGSQEWMAENLKTNHYLNGDPIPTIENPQQWISLSTGAACWFNNDSSQYNCPFGKLYNWYAVNDSRGICPSNWHVPTESDWNILFNQIGGLQTGADKLKSTGINYWLSAPNSVSNSTGFSATGGGGRSDDGTFILFLQKGLWWTSTSAAQSLAWDIQLSHNNSTISKIADTKTGGLSIRCIKN